MRLYCRIKWAWLTQGQRGNNYVKVHNTLNSIKYIKRYDFSIKEVNKKVKGTFAIECVSISGKVFGIFAEFLLQSLVGGGNRYTSNHRVHKEITGISQRGHFLKSQLSCPGNYSVALSRIYHGVVGIRRNVVRYLWKGLYLSKFHFEL